ncbi:golgi phosphoprotein 3 [Aquipluma nitroreducens]|uniref:Golgi phosphoprotein 3 n=1 Tax=Aquipluma nitroreducens TaxID=2010828 RepID=A0A5K7S633_9BACT|nr:GPP34 family phosphoprotein [Aquipluma nitroreducens]BBE16804.1 golgi phosphoprotein 3 [Aquipluma nitroreducens]
MDRSLKLSEKLFCLAVNPIRGGILLNSSATLAITLTGSVFVELMNKGLVSIEKGIVHLEDPTFQNDEVYEFFLNRIRLRGKDRKLRTWISYFNVRGRKIQKHFIRSLVHKNVLRTEERRILFIPYEKVFLRDRDLVESILKEVETSLQGRGEQSDESIVLAMMVAKTNLLRRVFPERAQRKEASRFLKNLPETTVSKAVQDAIQMMHAAVFVAAGT